MTLQASRLGFERGHRFLFTGISFTLQPGSALWLDGPNGSGKTSLLRLLCGLSQPSDGELQWQGRPVAAVREDFARGLCYIGHASGLKDDLTPVENLSLQARLSGRRCSPQQAFGALERTGLAAVARRPTRTLSQGQRKRAALARLHLAPAPQLTVLDEPFSALDVAAVDGLVELLEGQLRQGSTVVYTTHQPVALQARPLHRLTLGPDRAAPGPSAC